MSEKPNLLLSSLPRCRKGVAFVVVQYLSSICPVLVQYLSSELLDMYCITTVHLLHKIRSKSLANLWDTEGSNHFYEIVQVEEHF